MRLWFLIFVACSSGGSSSSGDDPDPIAEQTVVKMAELKDRACACTDIRCTSQVLDDVSRWMRDPSRAKGKATPAQRQRLAAIRAELETCEKKFGPRAGEGQTPPP